MPDCPRRRSVRSIRSSAGRLRQAVRWGWIEHNVAVSATKPRMARSTIKPPSMGRVHELLTESDRYHPSFGVLVRVAIATGMRRGELCGLRWCDVELSRRQLHVTQAVVAVPDGTAIKAPKSGATRRLSIDHQTATILEDHLVAIQRQRWAAGNATLNGDGYVFSHALDGSRPLHPDNVTAAFRRLPSNNGTVRLHDLRHAHATQLLSNGVDISAVQQPPRPRELLDHTQHLRPRPRGNRRALASVIGALLGPT